MEAKTGTTRPRWHSWLKRIAAALALALCAFAGVAAFRWHAITLLRRAFSWPSAPKARPILERRRIAKAEPDECFLQVGYPTSTPPCTGDSRPKVNQAYVWSGVRSGEFAYFGTGANVACIGALAFGPMAPWTTDDLVCELAAGPARREHGLVEMGDLRAPRIYRLDANTDRLEELTPVGDPLLATTLGIRGAVAHHDVVLLAGANVVPGGERGLNMWAYEGSTGRLLGSRQLPGFANMRRGVVVQGDLYVAMRRSGEKLGVGGAILKWTGDKGDPFHFELVGELPNEAAYVAEHEGRIVAAGWSGVVPGKVIGEVPGLYLSPPIPPGGLTAGDAHAWRTIFSIAAYEPDPAVAQATMFGDLVSWHGKLYFGTMQLPSLPTLNAFARYGRPKSWLGRAATYLGAERATTIFEMTNVGGRGQEVRLLYGEASLPAYDAERESWVDKANNLGQRPKLGPSGFGNRWNYYSWRWVLFQDRLYMGTFDASSALPDVLSLGSARGVGLELPSLAASMLGPVARWIFDRNAGGDIWRMDSPDSPAVPEDTTGFGNRYNYGMRVWVPFEDKGKLYGGTANPFNLRTGPVDAGGWELLLFTPHR